MKRQHLPAVLVLASLLLLATVSGCGGGHGLRFAVSSKPQNRLMTARVRHSGAYHGGTVKDRLFPFSVSGTRRTINRAATENRAATDPLRQTNAPLSTALGSEHDLAVAIANSANSRLRLAPFEGGSPPAAPQLGSSGAESQRSQGDVAGELVRNEGPESLREGEGKAATAGSARVEAELPSAEAFASELRQESAQADSPRVDQPARVDEDSRLREVRIQQLLDLLAKAEEQIAAGLAPPLSPAPIIERARDLESQVPEPQVVPQPIAEPKEIVLRAIATIPYQSVRSERVELLNVQQLAPTVPARPGRPAIVQGQGMGDKAPLGWANRDWTRELVPDFSALSSSAASEEVQFAPLPAVQQPGSSDQTAESGTQFPGQPSSGRIVPELDTNPATAARPIQKSSDRR